MKILEAQSATLTNYEVYTHLLDQEKRFAQREAAKKKASPKQFKKGSRDEHDKHRPESLGTITKEILDYLREPPSPLGSKPFPYTENTIRDLLQGLRQYSLTKGEIIMILNLRPSKLENLNTIIEEMESRFPGDEEQLQILSVIGDVLGREDGKAVNQAMTENANKARQHAVVTVPVGEEE